VVNAVEKILRAMKRTLAGGTYPKASPGKIAVVCYRVTNVQDPLQGTVLSCKYKIESRLGAGAMSSVYKAVQEPIGRVVALKVLKREFSNDPVSVKRFNREARIVSGLRHRNILSIHDIGNTDDGQPFFVMEYLNGLSLESLIATRGPVVIARAVPMFCQVCDGMFYAHSKGLVHRDLKPSNIMLVKDDDGSEIVKLIDFGIVKQTGSQTVSQRLTKKNEVWGSPMYSSPEQCMGNELDARTDIYSFGLVMYEALTGVPAFKGGAAIGAIVSRQLSEMPATFKQAAPLLRIPERLEQIVFKAIQKSPDDRWGSMEQLREELDSFATKHGIKVPKTTQSKTRQILQNREGEDSAKTVAVELVEDSTRPISRSTVKAAPDDRTVAGAKSAAADSRTMAGAKTASQATNAAGPAAPFTERAGAAGAGVFGAKEIKLLLLGCLALLAVVAVVSIAVWTRSHSDNSGSGQHRGRLQTSRHDRTVAPAEASKEEKPVPAAPEKKPETDNKAAGAGSQKGDESPAAARQEPGEPVRNLIKKLRAHKPRSRQATSRGSEEELLERIYLRKHRADTTQKWLDIQEKEQSQ
jgi:serine/threonine protein kinase